MDIPTTSAPITKGNSNQDLITMTSNPMPIWLRWVRVFAYGGAIAGSGFVLYKYTTPTDEQLIARFSPEVRAHYEKNRLLRQREQQELMKIVQETSKTNDPIWKTGKIKLPFERETKGIDPKLVNIREFEKEMAVKYQQEQLNKSDVEFEETQKLLDAQKKRWWKLW